MSDTTLVANVLVVGCSFAALAFVFAALVKLSDKRLGMWYLMLGAAFVLVSTMLNAGYWMLYWAFDTGVIEWKPPVVHTANLFTSLIALVGTYVLSIVGWFAHRGADWDGVARRIVQGLLALIVALIFTTGFGGFL